MNIHSPINDNATEAPRQADTTPRRILDLDVDYWRLRREWLPLNARWTPMHDAAMKITEAVVRALDGVPGLQSGARQWAIMSAISDATGATAAGLAESEAERRMDVVLGQLIDTPSQSLQDLAAKARLALLDLHGIEDPHAVDCDEADWPIHVMTRLVLDIERLDWRAS